MLQHAILIQANSIHFKKDEIQIHVAEYITNQCAEDIFY